MGMRAAPFDFRARTVCDAVDGSSAPPGAMKYLANLISDPDNQGLFVPRPASVSLSSFAGFTTPTVGSALLVAGDIVWGFIASARFAGKDEPFCYDIVNGVFISIANVTTGNCPTTQSSNGDWTPPTMKVMTNGRIGITHPGYNGSTTFLGWIDISSANLTGLTGDVHNGTAVIDNLSANPITSGWQVGMKITGVAIPANTFILTLAAASVTVSQNSTGDHAAEALTVTGGTPAAPLYGAGNLNTNPLPSVATCCEAFSGRAWWATGNFAVFSDILSPQQVTNASQALRVGDSQPITALAGLPLSSQLVGGSVQSLIAFKGAASFWQITGDAAATPASTLALNLVNGSVGTLAPNTICGTPEGLAFVSPDGIRVLGLDGRVQPARGTRGRGISTVFFRATNPTRMCAAYNSHTIRVSVQDPNISGTQNVEYWYDMEADTFSGPHTFPSTIIRPYYGVSAGDFIHFAVGINAKLWSSYAEPVPNTTYVENGAQLNFVWKTTLLPDNQAGVMNNLAPQATLAVQLPQQIALTVLLADETGATLDQVQLNGPPASGSMNWNAFNWGAANWGTTVQAFKQVALDWNNPVVFKQLSAQISGQALASLILGDLRAMVQTLGYVVP